MNILYWGDGFWPRIGGTETHGFQLMEGMQARGHRCLVIAQKDSPDMKEEESCKNISIKRFDFKEIIKTQDLSRLRPIREQLQWTAAEFRPDLIYLNTVSDASALIFLLFRNMFQAPLVLTIHSPYFLDGIPSIVPQICSQAGRICCPSKWGYGKMEMEFPSMKEKLRLILHGLSMPKLPPSPLPFSPPAILLLGRLMPEKGFDTAIEAFSLLKKKGSPASLLIAGGGPERPYLEHLTDHLGLRKSVEFTGELLRDGDAVPSMINRTSFVVMPSHYEAFGLVALESMQMQRPVIAAAVGGLPEIIVDQETGLLIPPKNPAVLSAAMERLLNAPDETRKMGERAREWAEKNYLLDANVDGYEHVFKEVHEAARQRHLSCV